jgi:hypothetical protein
MTVTPRRNAIVPRRCSAASTAFTVARDVPASEASFSCVSGISGSAEPAP